MNFKDLKNKIKEEQKILAQQITRGKFLRKPSNRFNLSDEDERLYCNKWSSSKDKFDYYRVLYLSDDYRHKHLAYCIFFNKTPYEKIEGSTRDDNCPKMSLVQQHIKEWEKLLDEDVRDCA